MFGAAKPRLRGEPEPECPHELQYLFEWYVDLSSSRNHTQVANGISYQEIESFERMRRIKLTLWELDTLRRIDMRIVTALNRKLSEASKRGSDERAPNDPQGFAEALRARARAKKKPAQ